MCFTIIFTHVITILVTSLFRRCESVLTTGPKVMLVSYASECYCMLYSPIRKCSSTSYVGFGPKSRWRTIERVKY